jgi:exosortase
VVGIEPLIRWAPAFVALLFLIPVPGRVRQQIAVPLETVTAVATHQAFDLAGVAVGRSGNVLNINGVDVAIAEACNGLRMIFALALVGYTFAFIQPMSVGARVMVMGTIPILAVTCNAIRLIPTVWLYGHHPGPVAESFHDVSGWAMLVVAFLLLLGLEKLVRWVVAAEPCPFRAQPLAIVQST